MTAIVPGRVDVLSTRVRRLIAPNGGLMTGPGTNCYLVGTREIAVIDVGCDEVDHVARLAAAGGGRIRWILLTHSHPDHAPGAAQLASLTGAPVMAYGPAGAGRYAYINPDIRLRDDAVLAGSGFRLRALHTPGHARDHLCYLLEEEGVLFSGDHVMQGSTVVIAPPDGDMAAYLASMDRLRSLPVARIAPGHGTVIEDAQDEMGRIIRHRLVRETQIKDALRRHGPLTIPALVARLYGEIPVELHPWAALSVQAHLLKLRADGLVHGRARTSRWRWIGSR